MILSRRKLLSGLASLASVTCVTDSLAVLTGEAETVPRIRLGAQTNAWSIDPNNFESFLQVLAQIRQVGYEGFETGYFNLTQQFGDSGAARSRIADSGLVFFGLHIALPSAKNDSSTRIPPEPFYQNVAHGAVRLGAKRLIVSGSPARTPEDIAPKAAALNLAGKFCQQIGLTLAYHNHEWEFDPKGPEIESLYAQTDPQLVSFLLDAGHAYHAGANVPAFLGEHHERIIGLHLRDYKDGQLVPLGQGTFPLAETFAALKAVQWEGWALNEEDRENGSKLGLQVIQPAFQALRASVSA